MSLDSRALALLKQRLDEAEHNLHAIKQILEEHESTDDTPVEKPEIETDTEPQEEGERIIEGVFDGQNMQGNDGEEYPVPPNYASKSKIVEGDVLKLTIGTDGSFVYKQVGPVERERVVGKLIVDEHGNYGVKVSDKLYKILLASVTFYQAEEGDEVTILLPENAEAQWGAVDNVIHK